jgi:hypothetical protein
VKIADFGLAKILNREAKDLTLTGAKDFMGTPHYMAPEQVEHPNAVDHRADIYSVGVVFYEMLTGELPLGRFAPPSRKVQVDVRLDEVVLHALEKEPALRYQQVSEVKSDVETIAGTPAAPPPLAHKANETHELSALQDVLRQVKGPSAGLSVTAILNWLAIPLIVLLVAAVAKQGWPRGVMPLMLIPISALVLSGLMLVGAIKMRRLEGWTMALVSAVLAVLVTPGNVVGLPVGIWALIVLLRPEVRAAFKARASGQATVLPSLPSQPGSGAWKVAAVVGGLVLVLLAIPVGAIVLSIVLPALSRMKNTPNLVVSGSVTDSVTGKALAGVRVADSSYGAQPNRPTQESWTDLQGRFRLKTWNEEHVLQASMAGYETDMQTLFPVRGTSQLPMDFKLQPTASARAADLQGDALKPPPVVIRTVPESGASDVDPNLSEVRVTFSGPMAPTSWAFCTWGGQSHFPATNGPIHFLKDRTTCVFPVKLRAGQVYAIWLNAEKFEGFRDIKGQPAVPYLLIFETRK